jgi:enamine deaminase RidA (YjgF/YER057c/UK114 family)
MLSPIVIGSAARAADTSASNTAKRHSEKTLRRAGTSPSPCNLSAPLCRRLIATTTDFYRLHALTAQQNRLNICQRRLEEQPEYGWRRHMRRLISSGSTFETEAGYSRAVADGEWVFVAGTTGFDYARMTIAEDPADQARQALRNIESALREAGAGLVDVVRVRYYLPDLEDWPKIVPVLGEVFGAIRPAATALVCGLVDPRMKIEIEVTALRRDAAARG